MPIITFFTKNNVLILTWNRGALQPLALLVYLFTRGIFASFHHTSVGLWLLLRWVFFPATSWYQFLSAAATDALVAWAESAHKLLLSTPASHDLFSVSIPAFLWPLCIAHQPSPNGQWAILLQWLTKVQWRRKTRMWPEQFWRLDMNEWWE